VPFNTPGDGDIVVSGIEGIADGCVGMVETNEGVAGAGKGDAR
jgi:hypothetical protein